MLLGLKQFSDDKFVRTVLPLGAYNSLQITEAIDGIRPTNGGTPLASAILESVEELRRERYDRSTIICLTDGENNIEPPTMAEAVRAALSGGIHLETDPRILVVGFGEFNPEATEKYDSLVRETGGMFLAVSDEVPIDEVIIQANYAIDVATSQVTEASAGMVASLLRRVRVLEHQVSHVTLQEEARVRGLGGWGVATLVIALFAAFTVYNFSGKATDKFTEINGKLDSFAADLNKLWNMRGGDR